MRRRRALRLGPPGRYVLQAAIAVEHVNAPTAAATRWDRIAALYDRLAALEPDPVVELNRAVAIALAGDLAGGLARIDALDGALHRYHYFHAARADLLSRLDAPGRRRRRLRAGPGARGQHRRARVPGAPAHRGARLNLLGRAGESSSARGPRSDCDTQPASSGR